MLITDHSPSAAAVVVAAAVLCVLPVPYRFTYDNSSGTASFSMSVYGDVNVCNETNVGWLLSAKSNTSQLTCAPGTFTKVNTSVVTNLWYTISSGGGSGGGGTGGGSSSSSGGTMTYVIVGVLVVLGIAVVVALGYWWYKRSQGTRDGEASGGEAGQYSTLA